VVSHSSIVALPSVTSVVNLSENRRFEIARE
jgi:hypothetical protein